MLNSAKLLLAASFQMENARSFQLNLNFTGIHLHDFEIEFEQTEILFNANVSDA